MWVRLRNTGESVLQGQVHRPEAHLSKDTWQLTSGNAGAGWGKEDYSFPDLARKGHVKAHEPEGQTYGNKRLNCILDPFITAIYTASNPQTP